MKYLTCITLLICFNITVCQNANKIKETLSGTWFEESVLIFNSKSEFQDTLVGGLFQEKAYFGFKVDNDSVVPLTILKENFKSTPISETGSLIIELSKAGDTFIEFDCQGVLVCGKYKLISLKNKLLILRSYSKDGEGEYYDHYFKKLSF